MSFIFKRKRDENPVEAYLRGTFRCTECGAFGDLEGLPTLAMSPCPRCETPNFIPLQMAEYWLTAPLGGGGMGAVYKGFHQDNLDRLLAIKVLPRNKLGDEKLIKALTQEFDVVTQIGTHPCIVGAVDSGWVNEEPYLVMDFIRGERLDQRINRVEKLTERDALLVGLRILSGEAYIYNRGFLFRDLKPENVICTDEEGAFLFDFGICMPLEKALHNDDDIIEGSPIYFPPERLTGEGENASSEIYSLGMVMYHAVAGHPYFTSRELNTIARQHMRAARLSESKMKGIHPGVQEVLQRMIARDKAARYQSFLDAERALLQLLAELL